MARATGQSMTIHQPRQPAASDLDGSCILELLARMEALELYYERQRLPLATTRRLNLIERLRQQLSSRKKLAADFFYNLYYESMMVVMYLLPALYAFASALAVVVTGVAIIIAVVLLLT